jgi:hypothetical protein
MTFVGLKCGKSGHCWFNCYPKKAVTQAVSATSNKSICKRQEPEEAEEPKNIHKVEWVKRFLQKVREVAPVAKKEAEVVAQPPVSPPCIFELEDETSDTEML